LNGDSYHAYNLVRELVLKDVDNSRIWNLFNLVIMRADDVRHNRFLMRLMQRNQDNVALGILNGHNCLVAGTYKYSLGEYMSAFKQDPTNPMVALMLGLTFTHMACQKFSAKKHSLVVQSCAFLNTYLHLRGRCQESYYNLGRAMHQLGLLPAALHYYKKALDLKPAVGESGGRFDLRRETAFNISLIYQGSGADQIARMYIEKYIVV
jgi:general transcription factor 3C polypeptide 3 (transcription factor C subunit 4)